MRRESKKLLFDAQQAIGLVSIFLDGKDFPSYLDDALLRAGVERQFEIIGEALSQLSRIDRGTASRITDIGSIIGFRNLLIHGYAEVDHRLVWAIIETRLLPLGDEVAGLLEEPQDG